MAKEIDNSYYETDSSNESDSESDNLAVSNTDTSVPPSYFGNIEVQNSSNVHFGNTAVYNGAVTIQQYVSGANDKDVVDIPLSNVNTTDISNDVNKTNDFNTKQSPQKFAQQLAITVTKTNEDLGLRAWWKPQGCCLVASGGCLVLTLVLIIVLAVIFSTRSGNKTDEINWDDYYSKNGTILNGTLGIAPFYSRADWLAQPVVGHKMLDIQPVPFVIISHSAAAPCFNHSQCVYQVRKIQTFHIEGKGWLDIGYNFLAGGDGGIYEGRGWDSSGAHAYGYNNASIGICTLGTFITEVPPERQTRAIKLLIEEGIRLNKISPTYKLLAHRQVSATESPGIAYYQEIQKWPHWVKEPKAELPSVSNAITT